MNEQTFTAMLFQAHAVRFMAQMLPLDEMIAAIKRAEAIGPIIAPSLFQAKSFAMRQDLELLEALRHLALLGGKG